MKVIFYSLIGLLCLTTLAACKSTPTRSQAQYDTLPAEPNRNTERARHLQHQALLHLDAGELDAAEHLLKKALEADVTFGPAHNNLGTVYYQQGKLYLAAWEFEYAAKLMPYLAEPRNNLGMVYEAVGKLEEATASYQQATETEPNNPVLLGNYARALVKQGDKSEALRETLTKIVMTDDRPEWVDWARTQLARQGVPIMNPTN